MLRCRLRLSPRRAAILDCGGKRSATPLWGADWTIECVSPSKSAVAAPALPAHSKTLHDLDSLYFRRSGVPAERRILLLQFSDGGFLPKAATLRNSRSVWTSAFATLRRDVAVASAPLFVRTKITRLSGFAARLKAPLKTAHSKTLRDKDPCSIRIVDTSDGAHGVTRSTARSVWTAVTSAPLFVRTEIIRLSRFSARSTAPLKPAHSKRFAKFDRRPEYAPASWTAVASAARHRFGERIGQSNASRHPKAPSPLPLCRRTPNASRPLSNVFQA